LLLVGFVGAVRRSELVALDVEDVAEHTAALVVTVRRSKVDQEDVGFAGFAKAMPFGSTPETCPVRALRAWLEAARITSGPLFRSVDRHGNVAPARTSGLTVARAVKRAALAAGLDAERFAAHLLRAGFVSTAALRGCSERSIANQTGHRSMVVLRGYIRRATVFEENAAVAVVSPEGSIRLHRSLAGVVFDWRLQLNPHGACAVHRPVTPSSKSSEKMSGPYSKAPRSQSAPEGRSVPR